MRFSNLLYASKKNRHLDMWLRAGGLLICILFCIVSAGVFFFVDKNKEAVMALLSILLCLLPPLVQILFSCRIATPIYLVTLVYALGGLIGNGYGLYYLTAWWDKGLHTLAGVLFALFGMFLAARLNREKPCSLWLRVVFALCFSMAISVLWEFFEFFADRLIGTDMQQDRVVNMVHSYLLGDQPGQVGTVEKITHSQIGEKIFPGYVDLGLIDTMTDMLTETVGALFGGVFLLLDRDRHPAFCSVPRPVMKNNGGSKKVETTAASVPPMEEADTIQQEMTKTQTQQTITSQVQTEQIPNAQEKPEEKTQRQNGAPPDAE